MLLDPYDAVAKLGTTPDAVAETLTLHNALGKRHHSCECPVSRYLLDACGASKVMTTLATAQIFYSDSWGYVEAIKLPRPVYEFIIAFDSGDYPQLEEREP